MLGPQLHLGLLGQNRLDIREIHTEAGFPKPWGGLWTSSFTPGAGSAWLAWRAQQGDIPSGSRGTSLWLLEPAPDARILSLDNASDLARLFAAYSLPLREPRSWRHLGLNWQRLASDFDALHVSSEGYVTASPLLSTWDCESTIWFRDAFASRRKLGELSWLEAFELSQSASLLADPPALDLP